MNDPQRTKYGECPSLVFSVSYKVYCSETCLCWPPSVPVKAAPIMQVGNLWEPLDTMKIKVCTITCGKLQFRVQRQLVEFESRYITRLMNMDFNYNFESDATRKFWYSVHTCGERMEGKLAKIILLIDMNFGPCTVWHKNYTTLSVVRIGRFELYITHSTKCETMFKIRDMQMAKSWNNGHICVWCHRNLSAP